MISGDELFSDTYPMKLVDDCIYEVYGKVRFGEGRMGGGGVAGSPTKKKECLY